MYVEDITALFTLEMGVWNDVRFVAYLVFINCQTEYNSSFLEEVERVVNGRFRQCWYLVYELVVDHVHGRMAKVVDEVFEYFEPLV